MKTLPYNLVQLERHDDDFWAYTITTPSKSPVNGKLCTSAYSSEEKAREHLEKQVKKAIERLSDSRSWHTWSWSENGPISQSV